MSNGRRHFRRLRKHAFWLSLAVAGLYATRVAVPPELLRGANEVGGSFLQTFGGIYGIIVAFVFFMVWQQHNDTQAAIEKEAVSLSELHRILGHFPSWSRRDQVRRMLHAYASSVPELYSPNPHGSGEFNRRLLEDALETFLAHPPGTRDEERLYDAALELFHELNEAREHRISTAGLRLPEGLRWFVFLGGAISVCSLWLLRIESFAVHAAFTAALAWVIVAAASIVIDLDDPYTGDFVVNWKRFAVASEQMAETEARRA